MDPFNELEQFVSEGYFSSETFKDHAIELCDYYDENNDMLLYRKGVSGESQPYEEVSWSEYFRDFLTDKCDTFVINIKRSHRISREAVLAAEFRLLSLIEGIQEHGTDEGIYIDVISQTAKFLREFRHQIFGPDPDEKVKTPKLSTSLTVQIGT